MEEISLDIQDVVEPKFSPQPELLLQPTIPLALHGTNPRTIMGQKWWDTKRREAYAHNNFHCMACGINRADITPKAMLHAHEEYTINYKKAELKLKRIIALCPNCHDIIHSHRYGCLFDQNAIDEEDAWLHERHKEFVLGEEGIAKRNNLQWSHELACANVPWEKWHLVIDGVKYFGRFKNKEEWRKHYATTNKT